MSMGFLIGKLSKIWHFCAISIFETNTKSTIYSEHKAGAQEQPMGDLLTQCTQQVEVLPSLDTDCKKLLHQNRLFWGLGIGNF